MAVLGGVSEVKTSLAAAEEAGDGDKVRFLRDRLVQLDRKQVILRENENKLMVTQPGGQQCLPCHKSHILVGAHLVGAHIPHTVVPHFEEAESC